MLHDQFGLFDSSRARISTPSMAHNNMMSAFPSRTFAFSTSTSCIAHQLQPVHVIVFDARELFLDDHCVASYRPSDWRDLELAHHNVPRGLRSCLFFGLMAHLFRTKCVRSCGPSLYLLALVLRSRRIESESTFSWNANTWFCMKHEVEEHDENQPRPSLCCSKHAPVTPAGRVEDSFDHSSCGITVAAVSSHKFLFLFVLFPEVCCTNSAKVLVMTVALAVVARVVLFASHLFHAVVLQVPGLFALTLLSMTHLPLAAPICTCTASPLTTLSCSAVVMNYRL